MNDYKDHVRRSMGLTEAQFIPTSMLERDEYPDIDPEDWIKAAHKEKEEHPQLSKDDANLIAKQHLSKGETQEQAISPTAIHTPIIGLGIRGSSSGGLPSGADRQGDISPTKVGGYDRITPQNLNSTLVNKTPSNPEIKQETNPIVQNPNTGEGVTHPHQIQVTAHEEPQSVTGASTDSDSTLKLKSAMPKGIDVDLDEESDDETKNENNNTAMIPSTSLSETFERHKRLMRERIFGLEEGTCPCGCEGTCQCQSDCKCKKNKNGICECSTCGCEDLEEDKKPRICFHCKKPHPCVCDKKDEDDAKLQRNDPETYRKQFGMKVNKRNDLSEGKHKAGCQCGFCKNKGGFGKKKEEDKPEVKEEGTEEQDEVKKQQKLDESYAAPFQRMRSLAGVGNMILTSNGLFENKNDPGANKPFNTNWKMDKEKAGFVKIDEEKLNKVKASLERKSKRGTLSDKELQLAKSLDEVLKRRQKNGAINPSFAAKTLQKNVKRGITKKSDVRKLGVSVKQ